MSDTWSDIQAVKSKQSSLREKFARRKKEREGLLAGITGSSGTAESNAGLSPGSSVKSEHRSTSPAPPQTQTQKPHIKTETPDEKTVATPVDPKLVAEAERLLLHALCDITRSFPVEAASLASSVSRSLGKQVPRSAVEDILQKLAAQQLISISTKVEDQLDTAGLIVTSADQSKLSAVSNELVGNASGQAAGKRKLEGSEDDTKTAKQQKLSGSEKEDDSIESLLSMQSAKQKENKKVNQEILELLSTPTAKEVSLVEKFKSQGGAQVQEFCQYGTKEECNKVTGSMAHCGKLHFKKIIHKHTDESLGDCSFLNTCFHMDTCKYVHYEIDYPEFQPRSRLDWQAKKSASSKEGSTILFPPQWIQCDVRYLDMTTLGKFTVVMADPPWDIHMELPYGTMSDDEMRRLDIPSLQDDGYIFLWVTGRAMELGRECLKLWGYERIDEVIWVKTNQLQRIIRTGRTGHWLNHGKEHCLVGAKGDPKNVNKGLDCDVIVAEVRATSHKPDEIYGIIERLSPGSRKIELFGRPHNVQPNWITLGNQLDGVRLLDPDVVKAFKKRYPDGNCMAPPKQ